jgi:hypothetical protein
MMEQIRGTLTSEQLRIYIRMSLHYNSGARKRDLLELIPEAAPLSILLHINMVNGMEAAAGV